MKMLFSLLLFLPAVGFCQKVKVNEYDKFIKQRRIELEPVTVLSNGKAKVSLCYNSIASNFYVMLGGFGWGASTIDANQEVIFLFSNDSTVTVKSTGLQTCDFGNSELQYQHKYYVTETDLEALSRYELAGIRKYNFRDFSDMKVSPDYAVKVKKLSALFIAELKKAKVLHTLKPIDVKDISKYAGDSVMFCSNIYNAKFMESSENKPTILDVNAGSSNQQLNVIIWEQDRKLFSNAPELIYNKRDVCISGVVSLMNGVPQIVIRKREQIAVRSAIQLEEAGMFVGDSIVVSGKVMTARYFANSNSSPTLLNMGAPYPDQLLTVVIENDDRNKFPEKPEEYFIDKEIRVAGKISLYNGKPQIIVHDTSQVQLTKHNDAYAIGDNKSTGDSHTAKVSPKVLNRVAAFPGGDQAFADYLQSKLKSPRQLDAGEKVTVIVKFYISKDGAVTKLSITKSAGNSFNKEVLRVLKEMPKWLPRLENGQPVEAMVTQAVTFNFVEPGQQVTANK